MAEKSKQAQVEAAKNALEGISAFPPEVLQAAVRVAEIRGGELAIAGTKTKSINIKEAE